MNPTIAVIIPSLNSPIIDQVLEAVLHQEESGQIAEIWVIGKDDAGLIPNHPRIHFLDTGHPVPPGTARNLGIGKASADLLLFLDSDCIPEPGWLGEHIAAHQAGHCVVGGSILPKGNNYWHLSYNLTFFHELLSTNSAESKDFLATFNLSVARSVIDQVGMVNETMERGEDMEWTTRMRQVGIQPYFQPQAAVFHNHNRYTFKAVWRDCALTGFHMRQLRLRYSGWLKSSKILRYPSLVLLLSPFIAGWATGRVLLRRKSIIRQFPHTIPAIFLTKIAWCWGAAQTHPPQ